ncbi:MAG: hypothetical protein ACP5FH_02370 [Terracidiphilus sp.]
MSEQEVLAELKAVRSDQKAILDVLATLSANQKNSQEQLVKILRAENVGVSGRVVAGIESEK